MEFTPQRLTLARKRMGLTIAALAKATEISTRSISAYENGAAEPTATTARLLAEKLQVSPTFFQLPEVDEVPLEAVSFRALSKMTARQRDAALSTGAQIVEFDTWLSGKFRFPPSSVPTLPGYEPELAAATVRAKRERRKEARPGELLAAALDLFVEKGFAATRAEEVAKRTHQDHRQAQRQTDQDPLAQHQARLEHLKPPKAAPTT